MFIGERLALPPSKLPGCLLWLLGLQLHYIMLQLTGHILAQVQRGRRLQLSSATQMLTQTPHAGGWHLDAQKVGQLHAADEGAAQEQAGNATETDCQERKVS